MQAIYFSSAFLEFGSLKEDWFSIMLSLLLPLLDAVGILILLP
jgi:hypothetical protein